MGIFATRARRSAAGPEAGREPTSHPAALPPGFEAVGEALASGSGSVDAIREAGRGLAVTGTPVGEVLDGLRAATRTVRGTDPSYDEVHAAASAWAEETLGYLHRLSCADPLTGLATQAHVRACLADLYRSPGGDGVRRTHALVVLEPATAPVVGGLALAGAGSTARTVFAGAETIGTAGDRRVVVVADRDRRLAPRVQLLRRLVEPRTRVWIEGLPGSDTAAAALLEELARA